jgi:hypothetical protein
LQLEGGPMPGYLLLREFLFAISLSLYAPNGWLSLMPH